MTASIDNMGADFSNHPLYKALKHFWHPVAYSSELVDKPLGVTLLGERLVVARVDSAVAALDDRCAHRGAALSLGNVVDGCIECPYHGWRYNSTGACVKIPAREELTAVMNPRISSYKATERAGLIWVCLGNPMYPVPEFPEFDDPEFRITQPAAYDWRTSTPRRLENFVDFSHFAFVHHGSIGSRSNPRVETFVPRREEHVLRFERNGVKESNLLRHREIMNVSEPEITPVNDYHVTLPHTVRLRRQLTDDCTYVIFMAASPIDGRTTRSFTLQARNYGKEPENDAFFVDMNDGVIAEDRPVIESQRPAMIPLMPDEMRLELPVRGADGVAAEYRRSLLELVSKFGLMQPKMPA